MKYLIDITITLTGIEAQTLAIALSPENSTFSEGLIQTTIAKSKVITRIKGKMKIGSLIYTIDDVIKSAIIIQDISKIAKT